MAPDVSNTIGQTGRRRVLVLADSRFGVSNHGGRPDDNCDTGCLNARLDWLQIAIPGARYASLARALSQALGEGALEFESRIRCPLSVCSVLKSLLPNGLKRLFDRQAILAHESRGSVVGRRMGARESSRGLVV
jgi:hypothetical protein